MNDVRNWIEEFMLTEVDLVGAEEMDKRVGALREMFGNWRNMNSRQFQEVMTTAHFADYFADTLSRAFYADYQYKDFSWKDYTYADEVPDFRDVDRYRMTEPGTLFRRREKAEAKTTYIDDSVVSYGVEEYARQFDVSWQTIMNDDLGKIRETPRRMANAAARWLGGWVSALYDNATTQAYFSGTLGAPWYGTGRLTYANLAVGVNAMFQRTDAGLAGGGNRISIQKVWLVIPPLLRIQADTILQSILAAGVATNDKNVLPQFIAGVRVDPYITTSGDDVPWYLFADPSEIPSVTVARLRGWPGAVVVQKQSDIAMIQGTAPAPFLMGSFATGDIEYMVEDVIGGWDNANLVGVTDYNGMYYSSGTTP
ncbi:hypothetical protein KKH23_04825 [Patescibacteria group bacterium]|nr:hypothetical protein [Patescibacteria group bacterium]